MSDEQAVTLVVLAYISVLVYLAMGALATQNTYKYLYVKKKYNVFPVCLFYILAIPLIIQRIVMCIWCVQYVTYGTIIILDLVIMFM